jgi:hypothetical protein
MSARQAIVRDSFDAAFCGGLSAPLFTFLYFLGFYLVNVASGSATFAASSLVSSPALPTLFSLPVTVPVGIGVGVLLRRVTSRNTAGRAAVISLLIGFVAGIVSTYSWGLLVSFGALSSFKPGRALTWPLWLYVAFITWAAAPFCGGRFRSARRH